MYKYKTTILNFNNELFDDNRIDILVWISKYMELHNERKEQNINEYLKKIITQEINLDLFICEIPPDGYRSCHTFSKNKKVYTIYLALFSDNYYIKMNGYHSKL